MLSPRLTNCVECTTIPSLIDKIDCKLAEMANSLYNNVVFMLNQPVQGSVIIDLLNYRRILTFKYCNPDYAGCFTVDMIASKVIRLTLGCVSKYNGPGSCLENPCTSNEPTTTTSSSTTTSSTTSSTTTTSSSSTTTTTTTAYMSQCTAGYSDSVGFPNRITGNGTMTLGSELIIDTVYVGPALLIGAQSPFDNCVGGHFVGNVGDGGSISLNYNDGSFTFTITYSVPQTAVKFLLSGMGYIDQLGISEYYTFTTNQSNSTVHVLDGCYDFRVESANVIAGSYSSVPTGTGGIIEVVADAPFTTVTITGNNAASLAGTMFDMAICNG